MFGFAITERLKLYGALALFLVSLAGCVWLGLGKASVAKDLKHTRSWSEGVCEAAGAPYVAKDDRGRPTPRKPWETACKAAVTALAQFERETKLAMANAVLAHAEKQQQKATTDRVAAQADNTRRVRAKAKVEHANASASGDRRGPDYLAGLNELMGLRDAQEADLAPEPAGRGGTEGDAAERPLDVPFTTAGLSDRLDGVP